MVDRIKREARARMERTGESYTEARRAVARPVDPDAAPAMFDTSRVDFGVLSWERLVELVDDAEAHLDDPDPYVRATAYTARARLYAQLASQTTNSVYSAACLRAGLCDDITAARIRFEHAIPTLMPRTEADLLGLRTCSWCGRPWQADPAGACEHCPRLRFGPAPHDRAEAKRLPPPTPVDPAEWGTGPVDD